MKSFNDFITEAIAARRATVRGRKLNPGATQREISRQDRKAEAQARAEERKRTAERDAEYARERRENPEILRKEAQKRTLSTRMARAAAKMGIDND